MSTVLILENDNNKIAYILDKNEGFGKKTVIVVRSVQAAKDVVEAQPNDRMFYLFLDYELDPGCGSGFDFLDWMVCNRRLQIEKAIISTFSQQWRQDMKLFCESHGVSVGVLKAPFSMEDPEKFPPIAASVQ